MRHVRHRELGNGKSESWISDRTGHKSSQMINRYKRTARTFAELQTGELTPLNEALIELASWHPAGMATGEISKCPRYRYVSRASPAGFEPSSRTADIHQACRGFARDSGEISAG